VIGRILLGILPARSAIRIDPTVTLDEIIGRRPNIRKTFPLRIDKSRGTLVVDHLGRNLSRSDDLIAGTLDLLILRVIALQPMHGWAIAQRIQQVSKEILQVRQGSLYPALHRLEIQGWISAEWGDSENNRRAKFYSLTRAGRKKLERDEAQWDRLSSAVSVVLREA